ncbi:hypothetical protein [Rhodococcus sp. 1168]|uniref:hypothetical protein n=1 Tax=Rhodococcus sp. 1168 TaxID=2018041 RepID=UPI0034CF7628
MPVHTDVPARKLREFAAAERAGEPEQQDRRIPAFVHLVGPTLAPIPCRLDKEFDVLDQQRFSRAARAVTCRGVLASDPGQGRSHDLVGRRGQMSGGAVLVVGRRDSGTEGGDSVGALPCLVPGVDGVDEIRGDCDRMRRQRGMPFPVAPPGEASPPGGVVRRVPSDRDDSTAFAIRLATPAGSPAP